MSEEKFLRKSLFAYPDINNSGDEEQDPAKAKQSQAESANLPPALLASLDAAILASKPSSFADERGADEDSSEASSLDGNFNTEEIDEAVESSEIPADDDDDEGEDDEDYEEDDEDYEEEDEDDDDEEEEEEDDDEGDPEIGGKMSLREHIGDLRKRVVRAFLCMILGFLVCYPFAQEIYNFLMQPLVRVMPPGSVMIFTAVPEAFFTYLKLSFLAGMFLASPLIFYQIWAFVAPGLYKEEKKYIIPIALLSGICFAGGAAFCFFMVFPIAFEFFMSYNTGDIQAMPSVREYLSFVLHLTFAFGLVFELPLFVFFMARIGIVTAATMRRFRRYAIILIFIIAAILTPPDPLSQLMMAGPMLLLYEFSILLAAMFGKKTPLAEEKMEEDGDEAGEDDGEDDDEEEEPDAEDSGDANEKNEPAKSENNG